MGHDENSAAASPIRRYKPGLLFDVERGCGKDVMNALARAFGGREVFIASKGSATEDSHLAKAIGFTQAAAIAACLELPIGMWVRVPLGEFSSKVRRQDEIFRFILTGASTREVAGRFGITMRSVHRYRRTLREQGVIS